MNSILHYFKNIKFNPKVNKTIANESKKKYTNNKQKQKLNYIKVRHFTTFIMPPEKIPPNYSLVTIASIALISGLYFNFKKYK